MPPVAQQERDIEHPVARVDPGEDACARLCEIEGAGLRLLDQVRLLPEEPVRIDRNRQFLPGSMRDDLGKIQHRVVDRVRRRQPVGEAQDTGGSGRPRPQPCNGNRCPTQQS
jgi:hypothetical protein